MSRFRASFIHLLISAIVVGPVVAVIFLLWYPKPAFEIAGAFSMINLLIGVDLVLGPLLTLVVYKHGKPGLKFDVTVIALIQVVALVYGTYTLYDEKPSYLVFSIDRVEFIADKQVDLTNIAFNELRTTPHSGLIRVFAKPPEDADEYQRFINSVMFDGMPDLERRTEYWEPWAEGADTIRARVTLISDLEPDTPREQDELQQAIDKYSHTHTQLGTLPVGGVDADISLLIDWESLEILDVLHVDPW